MTDTTQAQTLGAQGRLALELGSLKFDCEIMKDQIVQLQSELIAKGAELTAKDAKILELMKGAAPNDESAVGQP